MNQQGNTVYFKPHYRAICQAKSLTLCPQNDLFLSILPVNLSSTSLFFSPPHIYSATLSCRMNPFLSAVYFTTRPMKETPKGKKKKKSFRECVRTRNRVSFRPVNLVVSYLTETKPDEKYQVSGWKTLQAKNTKSH